MKWWRPGDGEFKKELEFHLEGAIAKKRAAGLSEAEARRQAALEFGGVEQVKEDLRDLHRIPVVETIWANVRYGLRTLRKSPSFSLAAIATLTLGIGANTAVFSAIDAVLLKPLPFPQGQQLMLLYEWHPKQKSPRDFIAPARIEDWNRLCSAFTAISGYYTEDTTDLVDVTPMKITRAFVAPRFLQVMGVAPAMGYDFPLEDNHYRGGASWDVLISDRLWRLHFHADPKVVGKTLSVHGPRVIGVLPPNFAFPSSGVDEWFVAPPDAPDSTDRRSTWYTGIARLRPEVTEAQALLALNAVQAGLGREFPATDRGLQAHIESLKDSTVGGRGRGLWLLFGAVSVLLLAACTNIACLLLGRSASRSQEIAIRFSLGAARSRVLAQLLTEALLIAAAGTVLGLALALAAARWLGSMAAGMPGVEKIGVDWRLLAYTAVCAVAVTILGGLFPAIRATRGSHASGLASGSTRTQVSSGARTQWTLAGVQVALAMMLLAGAGLLIRGLEALTHVSPGFETAHILTFRITGSWWETGDMKKLLAGVRTTLGALRTIPGVRDVAVSLTAPGVPFRYPILLSTVEQQGDELKRVTAESRFVSDGYFATMQIPVLAGAGCEQRWDGSGAVVNRSLALHFGGEQASLGHTVVAPFASGPPVSRRIIGVVADAREGGIDQPSTPAVYWCGVLADPGRLYLLRTAGDPEAMASSVRRLLRTAEPQRAVYELMPLSARLSDAFAETRLRTLLLSLFAGTALALACAGLYGTLSYVVTSRRREVGLRMALGAVRGGIAAGFLWRSVAITLAGCLAGAALDAAATKLLSGMLYGVERYDPVSFAGAAILMLGAAALASLAPALRAARMDPMQVLREE